MSSLLVENSWQVYCGAVCAPKNVGKKLMSIVQRNAAINIAHRVRLPTKYALTASSTSFDPSNSCNSTNGNIWEDFG